MHFEEILRYLQILLTLYIPINIYYACVNLFASSVGSTELEMEERRREANQRRLINWGYSLLSFWVNRKSMCDCFTFVSKLISRCICIAYRRIIIATTGVRERVPTHIISLEDVTCPICYHVMVPPVRNACIDPIKLLAQHPICNACLDRLISDRILKRSCPTCRDPLTPSPNEWATAYLENHVARCWNFPTCREAFEWTDQAGLRAHVQICPHNCICHLHGCNGHLIYGGWDRMIEHITLYHVKDMEGLPQNKVPVVVEVCAVLKVFRSNGNIRLAMIPDRTGTGIQRRNDKFGLTYDPTFGSLKACGVGIGSPRPSALVTVATSIDDEANDGQYCVYYFFIKKTDTNEFYISEDPLVSSVAHIVRRNTHPNQSFFCATFSTEFFEAVKSNLIMFCFAAVFTCEDAGIQLIQES